MHLSERVIEKPRLVVSGAILICLLGLVAAATLPKERTPRVRLPVIVVAVPNPGGQPASNERQIVRRIETESASLSGLKDRGFVYSHAANGSAVVQFVFSSGVDVQEAKRDVETLVNRIKGDFPGAAQTDPGPVIDDIAFEDWPVIQVFLAGGVSPAHRRRVAERLKESIERIPDVSSVEMFGGLEPEVQIEVNPHLMTLYGFSFRQVDEAIRRANTDLPGGTIESKSGSITRVRTAGLTGSIPAISLLPLGEHEGSPVLLEDVAQIRMGHKPYASLARYDGQDATVLLVRTRTDADMLATANGVQAVVDRFVADGHADGTIVGTGRSLARQIQNMIKQLGTTGAWGMVMVFMLLLIFLGWRNSLMIVVAVPFALLTTAAIMWITKRSITPDLAVNNMVLFAMILVIGLVVDGCIIVCENIYRHRELGRPPVSAAKRGIREVGSSLITAYLTTLAAFAPMFMVRGVVGDFMKLLPTVVFFALCAAMLVDHFILPVLSVYFMKVSTSRAHAAIDRQQHTTALSPQELERYHVELAATSSRVKRLYGRMLRYTLRHRLRVLGAAAAVALVPVVAFWSGLVGFKFFPESDIPIIEVHFELPLGSSMDRTAEVARQIEGAVLTTVRPDEWYRPSSDAPRAKPLTIIGETGALNTNLDRQQGAGPEFGMVFVELEFAEKRQRSAAAIRQAILNELPTLPGVIVRVRSPSEGPPAGAPVLVRVLGHKHTSFQLLASRAAEVEQLLRSVPGTYNVTSDYRLRPELIVQPNDVVAALFGLDSAEISASVNYALDGVRVGDVDFGGDEQIGLRLRSLRDERDELRDLANLPLRTGTGHIVSLAQVADIKRVHGPNVIRHYDRRRVIDVRAELEDGVLADGVKASLIAGLRPDLSRAEQRQLGREDNVIQADSDVVVEFGGENEIRDDAFADLHIALGVAAGVMMIILIVKFNSFLQALIILFSVPLSFVGVAIGLMICGFHFSIASMIGVVALSGIVVNDAIVLVDFINRLRSAGLPREQAVVQAAQLRLRPIFLTTLTTIGGLLPLALNIAGGGEFWQPLAVTIMFGLGTATVLQMFIVPLACYTVDRDGRAGILDPMKRPELAGNVT